MTWYPDIIRTCAHDNARLQDGRRLDVPVANSRKEFAASVYDAYGLPAIVKPGALAHCSGSR